MGDRVCFVFQEDNSPSVVLYSHWGGSESAYTLARALRHAHPRWGDTSYFTRMVICSIIAQEDAVLDECGFGIYATDRNGLTEFDAFDIFIDTSKRTVDGKSYQAFIDEHLGGN